jgi:hypothetical protein
MAQQYYTVGDIVNGFLFALAAILELLSTAFWQQMLVTLSGVSYLCNALLTLRLRRLEVKNNGSLMTVSYHLVRLGYILYLMGSILDLWTTTMIWLNDEDENENKDDTVLFIAKLTLASLISWFANAILYLVADKILLDNHSFSSNQPDDVVEMEETPANTGNKDNEKGEEPRHLECTKHTPS